MTKDVGVVSGKHNVCFCVPECTHACVSPSGVAVQLIEDCVVTLLKHQVQLPFTSKHLNQVHQVGVFQLLGRVETKTPYSFTQYRAYLQHKGRLQEIRCSQWT